MSESETPQDPPILAEWHREGLTDKELLGQGTEGEVNRLTYGSEGDARYYAYKEVPTLEEAQRIHSIYEELRGAGLPVADFLKIRTTQVGGNPSFGIAMADATEDGTLSLHQLCDVLPEENAEALRLVRSSDDPQELSRQIMSALAVMHNHAITNFHVGLSVFLRIDPETDKVKDFIFLDYGNFSKGPSPDDIKSGREHDLDRKASRDRQMALMSLVDRYMDRPEMHQLNALYWDIRKSEQQQYGQQVVSVG